MRFTSDQEQAILEGSGLLNLNNKECLPLDVVSRIKDRYNEPDRFYHDWGHTLSVLSWVNHVGRIEGIGSQYLTMMQVAALCHDVVYDPAQGSPKNEEQSIDFMRRYLPQFPLAEDFVAATAKHGQEKRTQQLPREIQLFLDCDLAYAFADPRFEVFSYYNNLVEKEYQTVYPAEAVAEGRRKFLEGMLTTEHIFLTKYFRDRFEEHTRANMHRLLTSD